MDFVSAGKNTLLLYVTVCEKVLPRWITTMTQTKEISWKSSLPEMKSWLRPCINHSTMFKLLLKLNVIREQRWMQLELQNNPSRVFAFDGKISTTV